MALIYKNIDQISSRLIGPKLWSPSRGQQIRTKKKLALRSPLFREKQLLLAACEPIKIIFSNCSSSSKKDISFDTLLRRSSFISLGDSQGKIVSGTIYHAIDDDLYIDFGGKFPCVCKRPPNGIQYIRGAKVKLRINDLELSARFLGSSKDLTLLEADCSLLGLISSPVEAPKKVPDSRDKKRHSDIHETT